MLLSRDIFNNIRILKKKNLHINPHSLFMYEYIKNKLLDIGRMILDQKTEDSKVIFLL